MEKIKPILNGIKQHHFWILCVVGVAAVLTCWFASVGEIEKQFVTNMNAVSQEFTKIQTVGARTEYPNEQWAEKTREVTAKVTGEVQSAWDRVIEMQQPALKWPELGDDFAKQASKDKWTDEMVDAYAENAPEEIKGLRKLLGAAPTSDDAGVIWKKEDLEGEGEGEGERTNYELLAAAYAPDGIRNADDCRIRQQALWVYQTLAKAIADTNTGDNLDPFNLPIHELVEMKAGQEEVVAPGRFAIHGLTEEAQPKKEIPGYDLLVFRLRVRMDLVFLSQLLAACANSKLPLDIQGLHIHRSVHLVEVAPPVVKETRRPVRRRYRGQPLPTEAEKPPPPPRPPVTKYERGTLVEIWGYAYFAKNEEFVPPTAPPVAGPTAATKPGPADRS